VLFAALDLGWLNHFATAMQLPTGLTLTLVDPHGTILARAPDPQAWLGRSAPDAPLVQHMVAHGVEGTMTTRGLDGLPHVYAFTRLQGTSPGVEAYVSLGAPTALVFAAADRLLRTHLAGLGLVLGLAVGITWLVGERVILRRVQALVQATQRLAAGDLQARTGVPYRLGELGHLARAFDAMADTLAQRQAAAQRAAEDMQLLSQQLWQAAKLATMGELVASIAHELNNPLATVTLRVESLLEQAAADTPQRRVLTIIDQEVERMATLVAQLLAFSRRSPSQRAALDVRDELDQTLTLIQSHLRHHRITVVRQFAAAVPLVLADRQQLRQVFLNLLTNASDAMPQGGTLTVGVAEGQVAEEEPAVVITCADTGWGSPRGSAQGAGAVFTTKAEGKGTGLGLPICRRIMQEHHGTIEVSSTVGQGTTLRLSLPVTTGTPAGSGGA